MARYGIALLALFLLCHLTLAESPPVDTTAHPAADTVFVIPAGPVAGTFTGAARIGVLDTIAGWAKIQIEGWVPVRSVLSRMNEPLPKVQSKAAGSVDSNAPSQQCEARTKKGNRCKRKAAPGTRFCWQHTK